MEDNKFVDLDEMMINYSEMTSFDFTSAEFAEMNSANELSEKISNLKTGYFEVLDVIQSVFSKDEKGALSV